MSMKGPFERSDWPAAKLWKKQGRDTTPGPIVYVQWTREGIREIWNVRLTCIQVVNWKRAWCQTLCPLYTSNVVIMLVYMQSNLSKMCRSSFSLGQSTSHPHQHVLRKWKVLTIHSDVQATSKHTPESTDVIRSPCETSLTALCSSVRINHTSVNVHWCVFHSTGGAIVSIYFLQQFMLSRCTNSDY